MVDRIYTHDEMCDTQDRAIVGKPCNCYVAEIDQLRARVEELETKLKAVDVEAVEELANNDALVRAQEREACALVCDAYRNEYEHGVGTAAKAIWMATRDCAQGIRARGNDKKI